MLRKSRAWRRLSKSTSYLKRSPAISEPESCGHRRKVQKGERLGAVVSSLRPSLASAALPLLRAAPPSSSRWRSWPTTVQMCSSGCVRVRRLSQVIQAFFALQCCGGKAAGRDALPIAAVGQLHDAPTHLRHSNVCTGGKARGCCCMATSARRRAPRACAHVLLTERMCTRARCSDRATVAGAWRIGTCASGARAFVERCTLAAGRAHVPRWPGRELFACADCLLELRCAQRETTSSRAMVRATARTRRPRRTRTC